MKRPHLESLYTEKGEQLSARTVQYIHTTIHKALKDAVSDGLLNRNVADNLKPSNRRKTEINPLTPEQVDTFLEAAKGDRHEVLYLLAVKYGLRQGELLGLKWSDVDLDSSDSGRGTIQVRRTQSESRAGRIEEGTKSGKDRVIRLSQSHTDALRAHRESVNGSELVFTTTTSTAINSKNLYWRSFKPLLESAGLPDIRFHDLRHTCATIRIMRGQPLHRVSKLLGHSSIAITADIYVHDEGGDEDHYAE